MQRDLLLIAEMIDAATQAQALVGDIPAAAVAADRQRRDGSIDVEVLHTTATEQLPAFTDQLRRVLDALESNSD